MAFMRSDRRQDNAQPGRQMLFLDFSPFQAIGKERKLRCWLDYQYLWSGKCKAEQENTFQPMLRSPDNCSLTSEEYCCIVKVKVCKYMWCIACFQVTRLPQIVPQCLLNIGQILFVVATHSRKRLFDSAKILRAPGGPQFG